MLNGLDFLLAALAAIASRAVNALAGGGTLAQWNYFYALSFTLAS